MNDTLLLTGITILLIKNDILIKDYKVSTGYSSMLVYIINCTLVYSILIGVVYFVYNAKDVYYIFRYVVTTTLVLEYIFRLLGMLNSYRYNKLLIRTRELECHE